MGNEATTPVPSLRRRRSKSVDDVNALVMESNVAGGAEGPLRPTSLPGADVAIAASQPICQIKASHSLPQISSASKWL